MATIILKGNNSTATKRRRKVEILIRPRLNPVIKLPLPVRSRLQHTNASTHSRHRNQRNRIHRRRTSSSEQPTNNSRDLKHKHAEHDTKSSRAPHRPIRAPIRVHIQPSRLVRHVPVSVRLQRLSWASLSQQFVHVLCVRVRYAGDRERSRFSASNGPQFAVLTTRWVPGSVLSRAGYLFCSCYCSRICRFCFTYCRRYFLFVQV